MTISASYDPINKCVELDQVAPVNGLVEFDVQRDLYSDAKRQWLSDSSLNRHVFPWLAIGGQPLPGGNVAPQIYFLLSPWKIRPYEADHTATFNKNLFSEDGSDLFVPTVGDFTVAINIVTDFSSGDPRIDKVLNLITEVWQIHGLDINNALAITDTARTVSTINQSITDNGTTTTVQRL